jgi:hypothetical protein
MVAETKKIEFTGEICDCAEVAGFKFCHVGLTDSGCSSKHKGKHHITLRAYVDIAHFDNAIPDLNPGLYKITIEKID